jgi:hypothetical protein
VLCKAKNEIVAEYALRDHAKPVGVESYITKLVESLPPKFRGSLPSPEQWQAELTGKAKATGGWKLTQGSIGSERSHRYRDYGASPH